MGLTGVDWWVKWSFRDVVVSAGKGQANAGEHQQPGQDGVSITPSSTMKVKIACYFCQKEFERNSSEVKRSQRLGMKSFCSRTCMGKHNWVNTPRPEKGLIPYQFLGKAGNRKDEFSAFRQHLKNAKQHKRNRVSVTLKDLKTQWEAQQGICPYTGWALDNPETSWQQKKLPRHHPRRASLDRIDSSKGYDPGNIQFVALIAQYAKHSFSSDELIDFCKAVAQNSEESERHHAA